jgi:hypothetical protein
VALFIKRDESLFRGSYKRTLQSSYDLATDLQLPGGLVFSTSPIQKKWIGTISDINFVEINSYFDQQFQESYELRRSELYFYYSLQPIILFANIDISRHILVIDTSIFAGQREYHFCFGTPPKAYQRWELKNTLQGMIVQLFIL